MFIFIKDKTCIIKSSSFYILAVYSSYLFGESGLVASTCTGSFIEEHPVEASISFRMDWLDLLAVQGTRKSLLQHHSSKASVLQPSVFFTVQLSHLWKNHSLDYTDICWQSNISAFQYPIYVGQNFSSKE